MEATSARALTSVTRPRRIYTRGARSFSKVVQHRSTRPRSGRCMLKVLAQLKSPGRSRLDAHQFIARWPADCPHGGQGCRTRAGQTVGLMIDADRSQPQDATMDCAMIQAEIAANNRRVQELADSRVGRRRRTSRREPWDLLSGLSGSAWTSKVQPRPKQKLWKAGNIISQRWPHIAAQIHTLAGKCPAL